MGLYPGSARQVGDATPVDIVLLDAQGNPIFGFDASRPDSVTMATLTFTAASQMVAASNPARRQLIVVNLTNKILYLAFAATATVAAWTEQVPVGGTYRSDLNGYTGDVSGILAGAPSGLNKVNVTEVTT